MRNLINKALSLYQSLKGKIKKPIKEYPKTKKTKTVRRNDFGFPTEYEE
jgi:hypothetical protein